MEFRAICVMPSECFNNDSTFHKLHEFVFFDFKLIPIRYPAHHIILHRQRAISDETLEIEGRDGVKVARFTLGHDLRQTHHVEQQRSVIITRLSREHQFENRREASENALSVVCIPCILPSFHSTIRSKRCPIMTTPVFEKSRVRHSLTCVQARAASSSHRPRRLLMLCARVTSSSTASTSGAPTNTVRSRRDQPEITVYLWCRQRLATRRLVAGLAAIRTHG